MRLFSKSIGFLPGGIALIVAGITADVHASCWRGVWSKENYCPGTRTPPPSRDDVWVEDPRESHAHALIAAARESLRSGNLAAAEAAVLRALLMLPGHPEAEQLRREIATAISRNRGVQTNERGVDLYAQRRFGDAIRAFQQALLDLPDDPVILKNLSNAVAALEAERLRHAEELQKAEDIRLLARIVEERRRDVELQRAAAAAEVRSGNEQSQRNLSQIAELLERRITVHAYGPAFVQAMLAQGTGESAVKNALDDRLQIAKRLSNIPWDDADPIIVARPAPPRDGAAVQTQTAKPSALPPEMRPLLEEKERLLKEYQESNETLRGNPSPVLRAETLNRISVIQSKVAVIDLKAAGTISFVPELRRAAPDEPPPPRAEPP